MVILNDHVHIHNICFLATVTQPSSKPRKILSHVLYRASHSVQLDLHRHSLSHTCYQPSDRLHLQPPISSNVSLTTANKRARTPAAVFRGFQAAHLLRSHTSICINTRTKGYGIGVAASWVTRKKNRLPGGLQPWITNGTRISEYQYKLY